VDLNEGIIPTPSPSAQTPTPTRTLTPTPSVTHTITPTVTPSITLTITPTNTITPTGTPAVTPTVTNTVTPTTTITPTPVTPTPTVTQTITPTNTVTPTTSGVPISLQFRYIGNNTTNTKQVSSISFDLNGTTYTATGFTYTTGTTNTQIVATPLVNAGTYVFGNVTRSLCKSSSTPARTLTSYTIKVYHATTQLYTATYSPGTSVPTCASVITNTQSTTAVAINPNETIIVEWTDTLS
jgi:hypothetical protein